MTKVTKKIQSGKALFNKELIEAFVLKGWSIKADAKGRLRLVNC